MILKGKNHGLAMGDEERGRGMRMSGGGYHLLESRDSKKQPPVW